MRVFKVTELVKEADFLSKTAKHALCGVECNTSLNVNNYVHVCARVYVNLAFQTSIASGTYLAASQWHCLQKRRRPGHCQDCTQNTEIRQRESAQVDES
jgi:hypothetical protein